jgi:hypothetical protein
VGVFLVPATAPAIDSREFRGLFLSQLPDSVDPGELAHLLYQPPAALDSVSASSAEDFLGQIGRRYAAAVPSDGYAEALRLGADRWDADRVSGALSREPLTIVVIPGIGNEFIDTPVLDDVFESHSRAGDEWRDQIAAGESSTDAWDSYDPVSGGGAFEVRLDEVVRVASLDDGQANPLVRAVLLGAPRFSLESIGDIEQTAAITRRRLEKYFHLTGLPRHLVILGYSRGTMVGLQLLSEALENRPDWLDRVRALVTWDGVTYGSDLADETLDPQTSSARELGLLRDLRQSLHPLAPGATWLSDARTVAANTLAWERFARGFVGIGIAPSYLRVLLSTLLPGKGTDLGSTLRLALGLAEAFGLTDRRAILQYSDNIRHFQTFVDRLDTGIQQLTTPARLRWWRDHRLPTSGIRYYSLAASVIDPLENETLADDPLAHLPQLFDYRFLLAVYRHFRASTGFALNDSQIAVHKARLWPELASLLNPEQDKLSVSFLGIAATNHWNAGQSRVIPMHDGARDPFPRRALLGAVAGAIATDLETP